MADSPTPAGRTALGGGQEWRAQPRRSARGWQRPPALGRWRGQEAGRRLDQSSVLLLILRSTVDRMPIN